MVGLIFGFNIMLPVLLPRVFGVLAILLSVFALAESSTKAQGVLAFVGFLILGGINFFYLSKKSKKHIFLANAGFWLVFMSLIYIFDKYGI